MPYEQIWVKPEKLLKHKGVTVYHTYKNDDLENGARCEYFVTDPHKGDDESWHVRDLSNWKDLPPQPAIEIGMTVKQVKKIEKQILALGDWRGRWFNHCKAIIKVAIEKGEINANGFIEHQ